jgi:Heterokaryon incompatibility protein (HET)
MLCVTCAATSTPSTNYHSGVTFSCWRAHLASYAVPHFPFHFRAAQNSRILVTTLLLPPSHHLFHLVVCRELWKIAMDGLPTSFRYDSLNTSKRDIRLIRLQPARETDSIECDLVAANLDESPIYEALSYEWGYPSLPGGPEFYIKLNGIDYLIRENLWWALRHLRYEERSRTLWVDALCINQRDLKERSHQVAQMGSIFSQSARVVAWIGREEVAGARGVEDATIAIDFLQELYGSSSTEMTSAISKGKERALAPQIFQLEALLALCQRHYWKRLWIIQELVLAPIVQVQCGYRVFNLDCFCSIELSLLQPMDYASRRKIMTSLPTKLTKLRYERQGQRERNLIADQRPDSFLDLYAEMPDSRWWSSVQHQQYETLSDDGCSPLLHIMQETSEAKCMDLRDKAFGLLNLSLRCCRRAIQPDYTKSLEEICGYILEHHMTYHSKQPQHPSSLSKYERDSPAVFTEMLLDGLGLRVTKATRASFPKRASISLHKATASKLFPVAPNYQSIVWLFYPNRHRSNSTEHRIPIVPGRYHTSVETVLDANSRGGLKPRFIQGEPMEGEQLYFDQNSEFETMTCHSKAYVLSSLNRTTQTISRPLPLQEGSSSSHGKSSLPPSTQIQATQEERGFMNHVKLSAILAQLQRFFDSRIEDSLNHRMHTLIPEDESRHLHARSYTPGANDLSPSQAGPCEGVESMQLAEAPQKFPGSSLNRGLLIDQARTPISFHHWNNNFESGVQSTSNNFLSFNKGLSTRLAWEDFVRSRANQLAAQKLGIFITDKGKIGYATHRCNIGDLVCETRIGHTKVAIVRASGSVQTVIGKGLLLHHGLEFSRLHKSSVLGTRKVGYCNQFGEEENRKLQMRLDLAHLLYLHGYF